MVNTELSHAAASTVIHYNILNIVVNTERDMRDTLSFWHYNILNIVVNTEQSIWWYPIFILRIIISYCNI